LTVQLSVQASAVADAEIDDQVLRSFPSPRTACGSAPRGSRFASVPNRRNTRRRAPTLEQRHAPPSRRGVTSGVRGTGESPPQYGVTPISHPAPVTSMTRHLVAPAESRRPSEAREFVVIPKYQPPWPSAPCTASHFTRASPRRDELPVGIGRVGRYSPSRGRCEAHENSGVIRTPCKGRRGYRRSSTARLVFTWSSSRSPGNRDVRIHLDLVDDRERIGRQHKPRPASGRAATGAHLELAARMRQLPPSRACGRTRRSGAGRMFLPD